MVSELTAEVIIVAIAVVMAGAITAWAVSFTQERTDETTAVAGHVVDCTTADVDIPGVYLSGENSRVLASNVGLYDQLTIQSSDMSTRGGISALLISALPIPGFAKGVTKEILFSSMTCDNFDQASVVTNCVKTVYDAKPTNC